MMSFKCIGKKSYNGCLKTPNCRSLPECRSELDLVEDELWERVVDLYREGVITKGQLNDPDIDMLDIITEAELLGD